VASVELHGLTKRFATLAVVDDVSLKIDHGKLVCLLGPSGCGKTTTLRLIAGFLEPSAGEIHVGDRMVSSPAKTLPPEQRKMSMIFQSYALWPHMTVAENIVYGLRLRKLDRATIGKKLDTILKATKLEILAQRYPGELSGGQQQRVALARALVKRPAVLLLDEPLGALDLKVRRQMQDELVRIKQSTGTTLIHVTHDQEEACAIADRIAVMKDGMIVQIDTPEALYRTPRNSYVAGFIDAGTIVRGRNTRHGSAIEVAHPNVQFRGTLPSYLNDVSAIAAMLPRNRIKVSPLNGSRQDGVRGTIERLVFTGSIFNLHVRVGTELEIRAAVTIEEAARLGEENLRPGAIVELHWRPEDIVFVEDLDAVPTNRPRAYA
jgi:iron(III) transport system ATP-binding protein